MAKKPKGYLALVLHAHLPYVRHPEENYFLEENWLFEAITETYVPLIQVFESLTRDDVDFRITMSISPTLAAMFSDPLLQNRYVRHIDRLIELAKKELDRTTHEPQFHGLALMYYNRFIDARDIFVNRYRKNLINAFKKFQEAGCLEIITCCATHGFLPNLNVNESSVRAQIRIGIDQYRHHFGVEPKGIWLPECGFYPGLDRLLSEAGIKYFFCDSHGIMNADPQPRYGVFAPLYCPGGVAAFGRDWESSKQVWSSKEGYPGDPDYREYYRDIGFNLDFNYIKPYIHPDGIRINTGIKYWKITGDTQIKAPYQPHWAREKAAAHAGNFMFNRQKQVEHLFSHMDRKPVIIAPYDAELFGHWWFEGPQWIDFLARKIHGDQDTVTMITPSEYLKEYSTNQMAMPSQSSWGYKGFSEFWLEDSNDWIYPYLHEAGRRLKDLAMRNADLIKGDFRKSVAKSALRYRALNQAARELLLAESSDWPFIMKTQTMVAYAQKRLKQHLNRFFKLCDDLDNDAVDEAWLKGIEARDNVFVNMNCVKYYLEEHKTTQRQAHGNFGRSRLILQAAKSRKRASRKLPAGR
jgi:1,4-alpha-glucan branching enzyme